MMRHGAAGSLGSADDLTQLQLQLQLQQQAHLQQQLQQLQLFQQQQAALQLQAQQQAVVQQQQHILPYGATLHHPGCGCPSYWKRGGRMADVLDVIVQRSFLTFQQQRVVPTRPLRVAYMLPHHNITGGMKCLVEHIRLLRARGHTTIAVHRSDTARRAMPPWTSVEADVDVVCALHQRLNDVYPVQDIDVIVVGIFHQVAELLAGVTAPVLYWEQGHEWVFGDPVRFQEAHNYRKQDQLFHMVMHLPVALAAVSEAVQSILLHEFGRVALTIPNGIDCDRFQPGPRSPAQPSALLATSSQPQEGWAGVEGRRSVLIVGNPALPLKGFDVAIAALAAVNAVLPLAVTWICQVQPTVSHVPALLDCGLAIRLHISPPQDQIPELYRGHDAFLFTSRYEAWGMPVMEAMASGLAIVATRCLGLSTFAHHAVNCLLADTTDVMEVARNLLLVLTDDALRANLQAAARTTALLYTPSAIADRLEAVLYSLAACSRDLLTLRQPCLAELQFACAWASQACSKHPTRDQQQQEQEQEQQRQTTESGENGRFALLESA